MGKNKVFLMMAGIFVFLFLIVVLITTGTQGMLIDENVAYWADQNGSALMETLMKYASFIGSSEVILLATVLIGIVLLFKRKWRQLFLFFVVSVGGVLLNLTLKLVIHRTRPGEEAQYIEVFNYQLDIQSYSFPSGHTMRATIFLLFLIYLSYYFMKRVSAKWISYVVYTILILAVALSRIMLDAHFATDILGAIVVSVAWFFLCLSFFHKPKEAGLTFYLHR